MLLKHAATAEKEERGVCAPSDKTMCQRVYVASSNPLPVIERSRSSRFLSVLPLSTEAVAVRRWFSNDAVHFAEAHGSAPCGCGFPEVNTARADKPVEHDDEETVKALADYLEQLAARKCLAELLFCWIGDEQQKPSQSRDIDPPTLRASGFRFRRGELLRVRARERR